MRACPDDWPSENSRRDVTTYGRRSPLPPCMNCTRPVRFWPSAEESAFIASSDPRARPCFCCRRQEQEVEPLLHHERDDDDHERRRRRRAVARSAAAAATPATVAPGVCAPHISSVPFPVVSVSVAAGRAAVAVVAVPVAALLLPDLRSRGSLHARRLLRRGQEEAAAQQNQILLLKTGKIQALHITSTFPKVRISLFNGYSDAHRTRIYVNKFALIASPIERSQEYVSKYVMLVRSRNSLTEGERRGHHLACTPDTGPTTM